MEPNRWHVNWHSNQIFNHLEYKIAMQSFQGTQTNRTWIDLAIRWMENKYEEFIEND